MSEYISSNSPQAEITAATMKIKEPSQRPQLLSKTFRFFGSLALMLSCAALTPVDTLATDQVTHLSDCKDINIGGLYVLDKDIVGIKAAACINIHDIENVNLNCRDHSIHSEDLKPNPGVNEPGTFGTFLIKNVRNFSIESCHFATSTINGRVANLTEDTVSISNSSNGTIQKNSFDHHAVYVYKSDNVNFKHNSLTEAIYEQESSHYNLIYSNSFILTPSDSQTYIQGAVAAFILSDGGSNNTISNNIMDGGWDGIITSREDSIAAKGADDGIVLGGESKTTVSNNVISRVYDCGVETSGLISSSIITNNRISSTGICGIGGWWVNSWLNNTVSFNKVDNTSSLFSFYRVINNPDNKSGRGLVPGENIVYFKDNLFLNNLLINQNKTTISPYASFIRMTDSSIKPQNWNRRNNIFQNNNFGTASSLYFEPSDMIEDGGGNICKPSLFSTDNPSLRCTPYQVYLPLILK